MNLVNHLEVDESVQAATSASNIRFGIDSKVLYSLMAPRLTPDKCDKVYALLCRPDNPLHRTQHP